MAKCPCVVRPSTVGGMTGCDDSLRGQKGFFAGAGCVSLHYGTTVTSHRNACLANEGRY